MRYKIWIPRDPSADALYRFTRGEKAGYIDQSGKVVVEADLRDLGGTSGFEFHNGRLEVAVSNGVYVDKTGKTVIDKGFYRGWDFSEGLAVAMLKENGKWGYIDTSGAFAISPRFASSLDDYVWPFEGEFAKIKVKSLYGFISHSGDFAVSPQFLEAEGFHDGRARIVVDGPCAYAEGDLCAPPEFVPKGAKTQSPPPLCKYTFIDETGRVITKQRFDGAGEFGEGLAPVRMGNVWGYINKGGDFVIAPRFQSAEPFSGDIAVVSEGGLFGYIDKSGVYVIKPQFEYAESFSEGKAVVGDQDAFWYIDRSGQQAIPGQFDLASPFFKGLAHVRLNDESYAYIDRTGRIIFNYRP